MSQPPYDGGPPEEEHPSQSQGGTAPGQPEGGPSSQYPPQGSQQQPPGSPGGTGPSYVSGGSPQYPGASGPQYGAGGQGPTYPPPGGPGQGWYQQPPSGGGRNTGLILGVVIAVGVLLLGVLGLIGVNMLRDDDKEAGGDTATADTTAEDPTRGDEETSEPPSTGEVVGQCLPYEFVFDIFGSFTACDGAGAFWKVNNASDSVSALADADGQLIDSQPALDFCGEEYGAFQLGELWKQFFFTYDSATGVVGELLCVEALGNPDAAGRLPITPDTGSCFDDSDQWWTVPCDQPQAVYTVVDTVSVEPPRTMTQDEADEETAPCSGGAFFWQVLDVGGRTTDILCGDAL